MAAAAALATLLAAGCGLLALATVVHAASDQTVLQHDMFATFLAVPVGWLAFAVLVLRELDESFADTYSTVVSMQNVRSRWDRRALAVAVGAVSTVLALALDITNYFDFLYLLGSVFVPMFAVFVADYFLLGGQRAWNTTHQAPARWAMLLPWLAGFASYQLVNPANVGGWHTFWTATQGWLQFTPQSWMSASVLSFAVAFALALPLGALDKRRGYR